MNLKSLRWATVWLPILFIILIELIEDLVLEPILGRWVGHLVTFLVVGLAATMLSHVVFRIVGQAEKRLRQQNRDLAAVNEISQVVRSSLDLNTLLRRAMDGVLEVFGTEAADIFLLNRADDELVFEMHRGMFSEAFQEIKSFPIGEGIPGTVAVTGEVIVVRDLATDARVRRKSIVAHGIQSMASVPLRAKDRVVGVMNIAGRHQTYSPEDVSLLLAIGDQIGLAIENARLFTRNEETLGHLNAVIESSGDAIITTDLAGNIQTWNRAAEQIYGWTAEEALGRYLPMVPEHRLQEATELLVRLRAGETIHNLETERVHRSSRMISVVVTASPVRDASGAIIGLAGISKDISEKKQLEAEILRQRQSLAVLEERERIAREMHDGLAQLLGYVNTKAQAVNRLLSVGRNDEAKAYLLQLEEAAREVYADVREAILGLRTTISGRTGLARTLEEYLRNFELQSGVCTELHVGEHSGLDHISPLVEMQLIRIIQESLTNVRKHAKAEQVRIDFERVNEHIRATVEDNGCGFDRNKLQRSGRPRFGLQTMRERAEGVGGTLAIHSVPGGGTRVCVTLPLLSVKN